MISIDLVGRRFGRRVVLGFSHSDASGISCWRCLCDCGKEKIIRGISLRKGKSQSCGSSDCRKNLRGTNFGKRAGEAPRFLDLIGGRFGRWVVLGLGEKLRITRTGHRSYYWLCVCDCGRTGEISGVSLRIGSSKSCGCLAKELASKQMKARTGPLNPNFGKRGDQVWNFKGYPKKRPRNADYKFWRSSVFERDNYTCQRVVCVVRGFSLNAHHIKSWLDFPESRLDIDNGVTLCEDCHSLFHISFGHRGFSPRDTQVFLEIGLGLVF